MSTQHPSTDPTPGRFLSLPLPPSARHGAPLAGEVVLARIGDEPRPDAVVLALGGDAGDVLEVRRVGRVTADAVELLPVDGGEGPATAPRVVPRAGGAVVGTVVLRWEPW